MRSISYVVDGVLQAICTLTHVIILEWCFTARDAASGQPTAVTLRSTSRPIAATSILVSCAVETTRLSSHSLTTRASTTCCHLQEPATLLAYRLVFHDHEATSPVYIVTTEQLRDVRSDVDFRLECLSFFFAGWCCHQRWGLKWAQCATPHLWRVKIAERLLQASKQHTSASYLVPHNRGVGSLVYLRV